MSSSADFKLNQAAVTKLETAIWNGMSEMGYQIQRNAMLRAPVLSGDLRRTIRSQVLDEGKSLVVLAGGSWNGLSVPYAWIREQGPNRSSATEHYMQNAYRDVVSGDWIKKYFGDITR